MQPHLSPTAETGRALYTWSGLKRLNARAERTAFDLRMVGRDLHGASFSLPGDEGLMRDDHVHGIMVRLKEWVSNASCLPDAARGMCG